MKSATPSHAFVRWGIAKMSTLKDFQKHLRKCGHKNVTKGQAVAALRQARAQLRGTPAPIAPASPEDWLGQAVARAWGPKRGRRKAFKEDEHPRDDHGKFVSEEAIADAKGDPAKTKELQAKVTDPKQRAKLDAALGSKPTKEKNGPAPLPTKPSGLEQGADGTRPRRHSADPARAQHYADSRTDRFAQRYGPGKDAKAPSPGPTHTISDHELESGCCARVGVRGNEVPPPPAMAPMPNLTPAERKVEGNFMAAFNKDPDGMAKQYVSELQAKAARTGKPEDGYTFETDGAKSLSPDWNDTDPEKQFSKRGNNNVALHQVANAIVKRAFLQHLDGLPQGANILVTVGGCGAGKGHALDNVEAVKPLKRQAGAIWDSAGDQNATENGWIQAEAEKRGLNVTYAYVHADPRNSWSGKFGVVQRANDPKNGRMVDAAVFADSYALGARNHAKFAGEHANNPAAKFIYLDNGTGAGPQQVAAMPEAALHLDRHELRAWSVHTIKQRTDLRPAVVAGALKGGRIWPVPT